MHRIIMMNIKECSNFDYEKNTVSDKRGSGRRPRDHSASEMRRDGGRESSMHLRVKWTVDKINRDGKEIFSCRTRTT